MKIIIFLVAAASAATFKLTADNLNVIAQNMNAFNEMTLIIQRRRLQKAAAIVKKNENVNCKHFTYKAESIYNCYDKIQNRKTEKAAKQYFNRFWQTFLFR